MDKTIKTDKQSETQVPQVPPTKKSEPVKKPDEVPAGTIIVDEVKQK